MAVAEIAPAAFADAMARHCAGVAVATCRREGAAGHEPVGLAVTSLTAFTAEPPSVLLSIDHAARTHDAIVASDGIGVHLLAHHQDEPARVFASKSDDKFAALEWEWDGEVPRLHGVLAYLRCRLDRSFVHHDHTIVIATVEEVELDRESRPLIYLDRHTEWQLVERGVA